MRLADAIVAGTSTSKNFDGTWVTTWTCTNFSKFPGYSFQFPGQVKDGSYHAQKGKPGEPASLDIDGKIEADGTAAFFGKGYVGSIVVALGAPRGSQYAFHALGHFTHSARRRQAHRGPAVHAEFYAGRRKCSRVPRSAPRAERTQSVLAARMRARELSNSDVERPVIVARIERSESRARSSKL